MLELTSVHHYFLRSFPMEKKNLFVILEGIAVVGPMKSDVFILIYHLKRSGTVFNNQYELIIV